VAITIFNPDKHTLDFNFEYNEQETLALKQSMAGNQTPSIDDLRRIALWKIDRVLDVPDTLLEKLGDLAGDETLTHRSSKAKAVIQALIEQPGIGMPMASAILKFLRPDIFPIIDVRAYRALVGKRLYYASYKVDLYLAYIDDLKALSEKLDIGLSEMDEQLYCFDREYNGTINS